MQDKTLKVKCRLSTIKKVMQETITDINIIYQVKALIAY